MTERVNSDATGGVASRAPEGVAGACDPDRLPAAFQAPGVPLDIDRFSDALTALSSRALPSYAGQIAALGLASGAGPASENNVNEPRANAVMQHGLSLFSSIRQLDEQWAREVRAGRLPFRWENSRALCGVYRRWYEPTRVLLDQISRGGTTLVASACYSKMRLACREAYFPATADVGRLERAVDQVARA